MPGGSVSHASPLTVLVEAETGTGGFAEHYTKCFGDVADIYADKHAAAAIDPTRITYEVFSNRRTGADGELVFGTSILYPGLVGSEYAMTRGHLHQIVNRAEIYYCLSGHGVLLLEDWDGVIAEQEMTPGSLVYVPGGWIHRSVNVGRDALVSLFCFASDAGQDYAIIDRANGMASRVIAGDDSSWTLVANPDYIRRNATDRP